MIYNNNAMFGHGSSNLLFNLNKLFDSAFGYDTHLSAKITSRAVNYVKNVNWKYLNEDWKYKNKNFGSLNSVSSRVKKNVFNQFIYSPLYYDNVPFLDTKNNFSEENFLNNQNYFSFSGINEGNQFIKNTLSFFYSELNSLTFILETFFNCSIKLELNRLEDPYTDSNIMAQIIGINGKNYTFEKIKKIFFPKYNYLNPKRVINFKNKNFFLPKNNKSTFSINSGLKIRVAGRFYLHKIVPRKTVSAVQIGSMARGVISLVEKARYTNKSKRGSFSVTV
uniref:ribosomal protein S3 n=1 Tax=Elmerina hispida TaxID=1245649 RepID=UPI00300295DC|nr:ribosomal protein S3 [Elmerina hispida]